MSQTTNETSRLDCNLRPSDLFASCPRFCIIQHPLPRHRPLPAPFETGRPQCGLTIKSYSSRPIWPARPSITVKRIKDLSRRCPSAHPRRPRARSAAKRRAARQLPVRQSTAPALSWFGLWGSGQVSFVSLSEDKHISPYWLLQPGHFGAPLYSGRRGPYLVSGRTWLPPSQAKSSPPAPSPKL